METLPQPIRVFLLTTDAKLGGTERALLRFLEGADREAFTFHVAALKGQGGLLAAAQALGIETTTVDLGRAWTWWRMFRLRSALHRFRPHVLHSQLFHANLAARWLGPAAGDPVIITGQRSTDPWRRFRHNILDRLTRYRSQLAIANSEVGATLLCDTLHWPLDRVRVIYNGIGADFLDYPSPDVAALRVAHGLSPDEQLLLQVANFNPAKDFATLFRALGIVVQSYPRARLALVGSGRREAEVQQLARELGVSGRVLFLGAQGDVRPWLAAADVFVFASKWEGFPNAVLEAMALGKPVAATAAGGVVELIESERTGLLVPVGDAEALAAAIGAYLQSPFKAQELGRLARAWVSERFSQHRYVRELQDAYRHALRWT